MKPYIAPIILFLPLFLLGGCSIAGQPSPDQVLSRFGQQLAQLQSVHYQAKLSLAGGLTTNLKTPIDSAQLELTGDIASDLNSPIDFTADASISAHSDTGPVQLSGKVIGLADYTYFQLQDLALPNILPISLSDQQWYKVASGQSSNISGQLTSGQRDSIRTILEQSQALETSEIMPVATVNGRRAYHYRLTIDADQLRSVLSNIYEVLGWKSDALPVLDFSQYQTEVYIDTADYHLLRLQLAGLYTHDHLPTQLDLTLDLTNHNRPAKIVAPAGVKDVDITNLLHLP